MDTLDWPDHRFGFIENSMKLYTTMINIVFPKRIARGAWNYFVQEAFITFYEYIVIYGPPGVVLWGFGSRGAWNTQANLLDGNDEDIISYRDSVQSTASSIGVAGAIIAQVAITALSLQFLSQVHWVAHALWVFSLVSGIMTVYYSVKQQSVMGRLSHPKEIREWLRGIEVSRSLETMAIQNHRPNPRWFLPGVPSVLTVSAPELLMGASLASFLIGLGVYLGFVWSKQLDIAEGTIESRDVFIIYIISITISYLVYTLSIIAQYEDTYQRPRDVAERNFMTWKVNSMGQNHGQSPLIARRDLDQASAITAPVDLAELLRRSARLHRESAANDEVLAIYYQQQGTVAKP